MERITGRSTETVNKNGITCTFFRFPVCNERQGHCEGCPINEAAWARLAAYEDTGLFPAEVSKILVELAGDKLETIKSLQKRIHDQKRDNRRMHIERNLAVKALESLIKGEENPCQLCFHWIQNAGCAGKMKRGFTCWKWKGSRAGNGEDKE